MGWRSEEVEAAWTAETGWNILTLACAMDDEAAVEELLGASTPKEEARRLLSAKGASLVVPGLPSKKHPKQSDASDVRAQGLAGLGAKCIPHS